MENFYNLPVDNLAQILQADTKKGLTSNEAFKRLQKYGINHLQSVKSKSPFLIFVSQFADFLIGILLVASLASFLFGEVINAVMILIIIFINVVVGFIQEYKVEQSIKHLRQLVNSQSTVYRDGKLTQINSEELVPGDLISIDEGQKISADIRLIQVYQLKVIESALTGESEPVKKTSDLLNGTLPLGDQKNMLFSGTMIASGKGIGIVVKTGMDTEIGKITALVTKENKEETPMQIKLNNLGQTIGKIVLVIAFIVGIEEIFLTHQRIVDALTSAVSLAVAAIPEGLPTVITISLVLGTMRLLKEKALVRNLPAAETLGSTDIICTDKTGTLTKGIMSVREFYYDQQLHLVEHVKPEHLKTSLQQLLVTGILANNARKNGDKILGDNTEAALIDVSEQFNFIQANLLMHYPKIYEIPFSSERKMMTSVYKDNDDILITSKGATEVILNKCNFILKQGKIYHLSIEEKKLINDANNKMSDKALRVLAFAYKKMPAYDEKKAESNLVFLGLQGMMDPPRDDIKQIIEQTQKKSGIKIIMITGDYLRTAQAIAKEIGIGNISITGEELDKLTEEEFLKKVEYVSIYARVNPEHKMRIINALKKNGHQVAMTGDGVNDAPALKSADIGIAMGIKGTDVAKDSSDIILLDDDFHTIVSAIKEGRTIFDNIRKFVNYLLSSNIMEASIIFIAVTVGLPLPLLPIHMLWVNLITDGMPAIALSVDPPRNNIMSYSPKHFREQIINGKFLRKIITASIILTIAVLSLFIPFKSQIHHAQSMVFTAVVLFEILRIIYIRSEYGLSLTSNKILLLSLGAAILLQLIVLYLPFSFFNLTLQKLFQVQSLSINDWLLIILIGILAYIAMQMTIVLPSLYTKLNKKLKFQIRENLN